MEAMLAPFRALFPSLQERVHLASCSYAPRSVFMTAALERMHKALESDQPWPVFEGRVEALRGLLAQLLECELTQISLQPSATVAAYQVASTRDWRTRPRILACTAEFPSLMQVWKAQEARGAELVLIEPRSSAAATLEAYRAAMDERVGLVSIPALDFVSGVKLPVQAVAQLARRFEAASFCDAYQWLGTEPVSAPGLGVDYLAGGSMKYLLGQPGLAFLYARQPTQEQAVPTLTGWQGRTDPFAFDPLAMDRPPTARRYETGTPAIGPVYAAAAGITALLDLGLHRVAERIGWLKAYAQHRIPALAQRPHASAPSGGHLALPLADAQAARQLDHHLREHRIQTSPRRDALRIAFHAFNGPDDVDRLADALSAAAARGLCLSKKDFA